VGTLTGDHALLVTRLNQTLKIAGQSFPTPIVHLTDELSSLGGEVLRYFSITFDQTKQQISFQRDSRRPVQQPPLRGTGLKFRKTPAYWRVINIVPNSPANDAQLDTAVLVSRINGEPVAAWDFLRYEQLITEAQEITYTLLHGTIETSITLPVADLVP
jgi:C-terminal processing protease CtpA/Prc